MDNNSMAIRKLKFHMSGRNPQTYQTSHRMHSL